MPELNLKTKEIAAVAASIAGNCLPCLKYHFTEAVKQGCSKEELYEVIMLANTIKQRPTEHLNEMADQLLKTMDTK